MEAPFEGSVVSGPAAKDGLGTWLTMASLRLRRHSALVDNDRVKSFSRRRGRRARTY